MVKSLYQVEMRLVATLYVRAESAAAAIEIAAKLKDTGLVLPDEVATEDGPEIYGREFESTPDLSFSPAMSIEGFANGLDSPGPLEISDGDGHPSDDKIPEPTLPVLAVIVDGGNVTTIVADREIGARVIVVDYDNGDAGDEDTDLIEIDGEKASAGDFDVEIGRRAALIAETVDAAANAAS